MQAQLYSDISRIYDLQYVNVLNKTMILANNYGFYNRMIQSRNVLLRWSYTLCIGASWSNQGGLLWCLTKMYSEDLKILQK